VKLKGSKYVFSEMGINELQRNRKRMLELFEGFKEYIESGEDTAETERIKREIEEMEFRDGKKKK